MIFLGVRLTRLDERDLVDRMNNAIRSGNKLTVTYYGFHTANCLRANPESRVAFDSFSIVAPDGIAVIYASPLFGAALDMSNRMAGDYRVPALLRVAADNGWRVFLLGGTVDVIRTASERVRERFPELGLVGTHHGYFRDEDSRPIIDQINASGADMLIVGMGQPKQEEWIARHAEEIAAPVIWAVGGYFDHLARRADCYPPLVTRLRLNWAYRLLTEPRRLWKRYMFGFPIYLAQLVAHAAGGGRRRT